jgi:K+-transporting ATPase ATPase C chain
LRANALLLVSTVALGSVAYPAVLLGVAQLVPTTASGSLVLGADGQPVGSRLIAQEFKGDEWFQARPSGVGYNAGGSGGSNLGANNPKLRDRVAHQLGGAASYRPGTRSTTVQADLDAWAAAKPDRLAEWVKAYPDSASGWLGDSGNTKAINAWKAANDGDFWETFAAKHPAAFPSVEADAIKPATSGSAVQAAYFEIWLKENPDRAKEIEATPADAVTASGSGLNPHLTLRAAQAQLDRVASARAAKTGRDPAATRAALESLLRANAFTPMAGLVGGEPLVNVLEVNRAAVALGTPVPTR